MSDIPQIRPERVVVEVDTDREKGSLLIPRINPEGKNKRRKKKLGLKLIKPGWYKNKKVKIAASAFGVFILITSIIGVLIFGVYKKAMVVKASVEGLITTLQDQDLEKIKSELQKTKNSVNDLKILIKL